MTRDERPDHLFDHDGTWRHHHDVDTREPVWWLNVMQFGGARRSHRHDDDAAPLTRDEPDAAPREHGVQPSEGPRTAAGRKLFTALVQGGFAREQLRDAILAIEAEAAQDVPPDGLREALVAWLAATPAEDAEQGLETRLIEVAQKWLATQGASPEPVLDVERLTKALIRAVRSPRWNNEDARFDARLLAREYAALAAIPSDTP